ncbi:VWA domain-containing protein [Devosia sp. YIM 151766]|uniref:vWA domain-containing protein n=1 Tax=Devosia sp. YIM 151766 TaxID=3017325 RepID=UPI00255C72C7|nr:VWA domain-containing protein [Devosia sp. YIM 151766]WIY52235.1 VWA domain-containing protein [Devosia sp. YIM 151766]
MMKVFQAVLVATMAVIMPGAATLAADDVVIVYDASGSMWGQIDGVSKIEIAREVMADLVNGWSDETNLGLVAYGHRSEGDCRDIETLIEPGPLDRASFIGMVNAIRPKGKTPISASVQHAADLLSYRDNPATVVLISDGVETCQADTCALAEQLARQGVNFTAHVVGFDLEDDAHASLACIAENTGGVFVPAQNASELKDALAHVQNVMDLQPITPEQAEPEPEPEPQVEAEIELTAPASVTTGASFSVSWSASIHPEDYVTIVPAGADAGAYTNYQRVRSDTENRLTAPADPGLYEVRYVLREGGRTLASAPVEVVEAEIGIAAPEQVTTGASFSVSWSASVHPEDYVTIVPAGADAGAYTNYQRVRGDTENRLTAPADPGLYEARYVLREGGRTLASAPVEVVEAEIGIAAPEQVTTGASFSVSWSASIHPEDYVTIVPAGADEGAYTNYQRVRGDTENRLTAPSEPGLYEARYVLREGGRTLASTPVEVVEADVTISAPEMVRAGTGLRVNWSVSIHPEDYITIVPAGADQGSYADYIRVRDKLQGDLKAPGEPGLYEIRYVLREGARTLASQDLEVVEADAPLDEGAGLSAPAQSSAGGTITVSWTGGADSADQRISLARADQADFSWIVAHKVATEKTLELKMPDEPGRYEVRYLDVSGRSVLGRAIVEVK